MNNIKVSIIMPVYNVEKYLRESLDTAVNQTLKDIEIICINDGSTDKSLEILLEYKAKYDNIVIINKDNMGQSSARNEGLKIANGKYIYFFDSDDLIDLDLCKICYDISEEKNLDILAFDADVFYDHENLKNLKLSYNRDILSEKVFTGEDFYCKSKINNVYTVSVCIHFFNKGYLIRNNQYFYEGVIHEDDLFMVESLINSNRVFYKSKKLFKRRVRLGSTMSTKKGYKNSYGYFIVANELYRFYKEKESYLKEETKQNLLRSIYEYYMSAYTIIIDSLDPLSTELKNKIVVSININKELKKFKNIKYILLIRFKTLYKLLIKIKKNINRRRI